MINGNTEIIAHIGYPTHAFKAPMIYNPWFEKAGVNAIDVPMGCQARDYPHFLRSVFKLANIRGALITMPHKVSTVGLLDEVLPTAAIAGSCNAVRRLPDGRLQRDMFDREGFVRGVLRKGLSLQGARAGGRQRGSRLGHRCVAGRRRCGAPWPVRRPYAFGGRTRRAFAPAPSGA